MTDDFLQFSAEIDPGSIVSGAPTRAPIVRIRDVIVCAVDNNDNVEKFSKADIAEFMFAKSRASP